jgi:hypothetical protein
MDALVSWLLVPLVLWVASLGIGLAAERVAGVALEGGATLALGFAAALTLGTLPGLVGLGATATALWLGVLAAAGLVAGRRRLPAALGGRAAGVAALAVYALYLAPVALSGTPTFAGYTILGDTSVHLVLADYVGEHGQTRTALEASSYARTVSEVLFEGGYPVGLHTLLAALAVPAALDPTWYYHPFIAAVAAVGAPPAMALLMRAGLPRWPAAAGAVVAVGAYLPFSYALQGGIKEVAMVALLLLGAQLTGAVLDGGRPARTIALGALAAAGAFQVFSAGGLPWFALLALLAVGVLTVRHRRERRELARGAVAAAAVFVLVSIPAIPLAVRFFSGGRELLTSTDDAGNLLGPLAPRQALGIWLAGDYRGPADYALATDLLILGAAALVGVGVVWCVHRRAWAPLLLVASAAAVWLVLPAGWYIEAKLLALLSPPLVIMALAGAAALARVHVVLGGAAAILLAAAIGASDGLAYRNAALAPVPRLQELEQINERFAGQGPALFTEFEEMGKHLLRDVPSNDVFTGYTAYGPQLRAGRRVEHGRPADLDDLTLDFVTAHTLIVRRRSPLASRPPVGFTLVHTGRWYEVWRRDTEPAAEHLPLGGDGDPAGEPRCRDVRALAARARARGHVLVAVPRQPRLRLATGDMRLPQGWNPLPEHDAVRPSGPGRASAGLGVPEPGPYRVWMRGQFSRGVEVLFGSRRVGRAEELESPDQLTPLGELELAAGRHEVTLERGRAPLRPGGGRPEDYAGVVVEPVVDERPVTLRPRRARALCERRWDWIASAPGDAGSPD